MGRRDRERKARIMAGEELSIRQRVTLVDYEDEYSLPQYQRYDWQRARKEYPCQCSGDKGSCTAVIQPGEQYARLTSIEDGKYIHWILCQQCAGGACEE